MPKQSKSAARREVKRLQRIEAYVDMQRSKLYREWIKRGKRAEDDPIGFMLELEQRCIFSK